MENAASSPLEEKKWHSPFSENESPPPPNNQSRLVTCPFSENKSRLGSGVTTPNLYMSGESGHWIISVMNIFFIPVNLERGSELLSTPSVSK
jgi:hypothetical protein